MKLCRWEVKSLGSEAQFSEEEWKNFGNSLCWRAIVNEIELRDQEITQLLRKGDDLWTDAEMRARLNELEFVKTIPQAIIVDLQLSKNNNKKEKEGVENG